MTFPHILSIEPLKLTIGDKLQEGFVVKELETDSNFLKIMSSWESSGHQEMD